MLLGGGNVIMEGDGMQYYVQILTLDGDVLEEEMGPMSERKADRVEGGVMINLNHDEYWTRVISTEERETQ